MRITLWVFMLLSSLLLIGAAKCAQPSSEAGAATVPAARPVQPAQETAPTKSDSAPSLKGMNFVYLHHSCGSGFMEEGGMAEKLSALGLNVHDITYGDGWIGDNTDPDHFPTTFGQHMSEVLGWELTGGGRHDIVAFKSCFPACNITSDEMLNDYKGYYNSLKPFFAKEPKTLFVAWTSPPLVPGATTLDNAARYRKFALWLKMEWVKGQPNVAVFDCYGLLAGKDNVLRSGYRRNESDSHPNAAANKVVAKAFAEWLPGAVGSWQR
jgi:hypothetical protein